MLFIAVLAWSIGWPGIASAQWSTTYEQFYLPGGFNFTFRREYPGADRLFNAFDYGHAILYERLYNDAHAPVSELEEEEFSFITRKLLVSPPRLPLEESAIEVNYAKIAPEAKAMFDWAHLLHRQIYDVLASEQLPRDEKDARISQLVAYYKTRPDLAFSSAPKNMDLMEGQPYSLAFRQRYPKFNGLIWGYHWLQVGLYEPLVLGMSQEERQAGVAAAVARFRQMLENAPEHMPRVMPMTAAIAPTFAMRYQEAAIIFDNLHAMHDVVSDILANDRVPHGEKRAAILEAGRRYRDDSSFLMPVTEWAGMGQMMGIENMGGPAVGLLAGWSTPTLARGATMADAMKKMDGMSHGAAMPGMKMDDSSKARTPPMPGMRMDDSSRVRPMPRMSTDSSASQPMHDMPASAPANVHSAASAAASPKGATKKTTRKRTAARRATTKQPLATKASTKQAPAPAKPMTHDMPGMTMKPVPDTKP